MWRRAKLLRYQSSEGYEQLMDSFVGTKVYAAARRSHRRRPSPTRCVDEDICTGRFVHVPCSDGGKHPLSDIEVDANLALASCDVPLPPLISTTRNGLGSTKPRGRR